MDKEIVLSKKISLRCSVPEAWDAITNPELTKKYMYNSEVISDWKPGGTILWRDADDKKVHVKGFIVSIVPGKYLQTRDLSLDAELPDTEENYSRVTYELKPGNSGTVLYVTEDNFNGDERRYKDADKFWDTVLQNLKELSEKL